MLLDESKLLPGLSGIMRVKNDAQFIEACVESCIYALDELIIVWNDCTDNSAEIIKKVCDKYPKKIKAFEYPHKVYSINLTKEEYEYAKSLPQSSPHLLSNYYNFALSKVSCQYVMKIDADQFYFTSKLKYWRNRIVNYRPVPLYSILGGFIISIMIKIASVINSKYDKILIFGKQNDNILLRRMYEGYSLYMFHHDKCNLSLSGLNVCKLHKDWYVSLGGFSSVINVLPPFNGVGDHLIFKAISDNRYEPFDCKRYSLYRSNDYNLIERFVTNKKSIPIGFMWYHMNMMRPNYYEKILKLTDWENYFMKLDHFCIFDKGLVNIVAKRKFLSIKVLSILISFYAFNSEILKRYKFLLKNIIE